MKDGPHRGSHFRDTYGLNIRELIPGQMIFGAFITHVPPFPAFCCPLRYKAPGGLHRGLSQPYARHVLASQRFSSVASFIKTSEQD
jgi:hypothetical protein